MYHYCVSQWINSIYTYMAFVDSLAQLESTVGLLTVVSSTNYFNALIVNVHNDNIIPC